jgi:two-component system osmolarity sensor histidine kinase EnvZ
LLQDVAKHAERLPDTQVTTSIAASVKILGNVVDLKRVFDNLLENARRYGKDEHQQLKINIACAIFQEQAVITFDDEGSGIPEQDIERLLRPFTRLDTARGQANGSGLGLAIVERIIKKHTGSLRITNQVPRGLTVMIGLPLLSSGYQRRL